MANGMDTGEGEKLVLLMQSCYSGGSEATFLQKTVLRDSCDWDSLSISSVCQSSFHGSISNVRSLLPPRTDSLDWMICRKFFPVPNAFLASFL